MPDQVLDQNAPAAPQDVQPSNTPIDVSNMSPFEQAMLTGEVKTPNSAPPTQAAPPVAPAAQSAPAPTPVADSKPKLPSLSEPKVDQKVDTQLTLQDEPPKDFSPKAAESWKAFKEKANAQIREAELRAEAKFKADIEAARKQQVPQDYEELKTKATQYETELKRLALERTPEFKKHYEEQFSRAEALARSAVPKEKADLVSKLIKFSDVEGVEEQLEAIAAELTPLQAGKLANAVQQYQAAKLDREAKLADSASQLKFAEEHKIKQAQEQEMQTKQQIESKTKQALELAKGLDSFIPREKDDAYNAGVQQREQFIKDFWQNNIREEIKPWIPALVADALHLRETAIPAYKAEIDQLKATIAAYSKGTPSTNGGVGGLPGGQPAEGGSKFMEIMTKGLA